MLQAPPALRGILEHNLGAFAWAIALLYHCAFDASITLRVLVDGEDVGVWRRARMGAWTRLTTRALVMEFSTKAAARDYVASLGTFEATLAEMRAKVTAFVSDARYLSEETRAELRRFASST